MRFGSLTNSRMVTVAMVYLSLFLDNVLLTVVVPIIPDYLCTLDANTTASAEEDENGRVGLLLSSKALVQLILNPAVGTLTGTLGYARPLFMGNLSLLLAALLFAFGQTYEILFLARSIQGIASACIAVSGMSLVASQYSEEDERSKIMGFVLGSIALGVLLGYPIGSVLYDLEGKMAPFLLVSSLIVIVICLQILTLDVQTNVEPSEQQTTWLHLLSNPHILIISGAIWCSTSPMAILEPCLPIWLRTHIKPKKWQLGTVFIPDSVGYLIGTNFFGVIAYRYGRSKVAILAMFVVGVSAILIPSADTMSQLIFPHLGMGLGIGVADAALVPLLASLVDRNGNYGPVYSIQQVAVSLAYSLGPIMSGEMVKAIGFPWVMRVVGIVNMAYCPLLIYLSLERRKLLAKKEEKKDYDTFQKSIATYERFHDSDEDL
ncbi:PREDICTED: synaptic vesicular amine transporter [Vollenhovia emeryi]|uniref:synaptic vesicular amine transporter n=1 Tax=Vollenhovia emeryi TaxID=411798 RepID=UPI0005F4159F|nr:PREDICTED: synaptic vesicular amine transporter [Vollenhovia emeryi]XP_011871667.1 PREDICTED: synaptic vesicular amine transporter [Vollenhovia emeryi]